MRNIMREMRIIARDQSRVFVELASSRRLPPRDAEDKYGLVRGRANAWIEFDINNKRLALRPNPTKQIEEWTIVGDVDLTGANAEASDIF